MKQPALNKNTYNENLNQLLSLARDAIIRSGGLCLEKEKTNKVLGLNLMDNQKKIASKNYCQVIYCIFLNLSRQIVYQAVW